MQQVLFHLPIINVPLYGFGLMLFLAFMVVTGWAGSRLSRVGLPRERVQDLAIVLFLSGIIGARILYMIQYSDEFTDHSLPGLLLSFVQIWNGGIVFYGSIFGGLFGYLVFRHFVLKRLGINGWQLADSVAPLMAIGLAIGRMGCFLNGCCWGQVACEECQPVPITAELGQFPLLSAHARKQVTYPPRGDDRLPQIHGLQTPTGFITQPREPGADPRTITHIEPGSDAERVGLKVGDKITEIAGEPNTLVLVVYGSEAVMQKAEQRLTELPGVTKLSSSNAGTSDSVKFAISTRETSLAAEARLLDLTPEGLEVRLTDRYAEIVSEKQWPRGKKSLSLVVERNGEQIPVTYTPRTVTFFPTQIYETVSMILLTVLLLAFQPFRRHDGQVMVLCMLGYAVHRFLNEAIRIEPTYALGLTLSQWISVGILAAGVLLEMYLRWSQPRLPAGPQPLGASAVPAGTPG